MPGFIVGGLRGLVGGVDADADAVIPIRKEKPHQLVRALAVAEVFLRRDRLAARLAAQTLPELLLLIGEDGSVHGCGFPDFIGDETDPAGNEVLLDGLSLFGLGLLLVLVAACQGIGAAHRGVERDRPLRQVTDIAAGHLSQALLGPGFIDRVVAVLNPGLHPLKVQLVDAGRDAVGGVEAVAGFGEPPDLET